MNKTEVNYLAMSFYPRERFKDLPCSYVYRSHMSYCALLLSSAEAIEMTRLALLAQLAWLCERALLRATPVTQLAAERLLGSPAAPGTRLIARLGRQRMTC